jgi:hypothetical protein
MLGHSEAQGCGVGESGPGLDADDGNERRAGRGRERLAARQDGNVVGEDIGFGEVRDADGGREGVEVFGLFPGPEDALGNLIGEGCGE